MATLQNHIDAARRRLLFPDRATCDDNILGPYCVEILDELLIKQQNTREPHLIGFAPLVIQPGINRYSLDSIAPSYGKARYLYTANVSNDPSFQREWFDLVDLETLTERYYGGSTIAALPQTPAYPPATYAAAVFNEITQGQMIEIAPILRQTLWLELIYDIASNRPPTKGSVTFTHQQFDALVNAKTAKRALAHCMWKGLNTAETAARKAEIRQELIDDIGSVEGRSGLEYLWWQFNLSVTDETYDSTIGFLEGVLY